MTLTILNPDQPTKKLGDSAERTKVLRAVFSTLKQDNARHDNPRDFSYPIGIPELERHLNLLADVARRYRHAETAAGTAELQKSLCSECPHQLPANYCPYHQRGGCVPFRFAGQLVRAVGSAISSEPSDQKELR